MCLCLEFNQGKRSFNAAFSRWITQTSWKLELNQYSRFTISLFSPLNYSNERSAGVKPAPARSVIWSTFIIRRTRGTYSNRTSVPDLQDPCFPTKLKCRGQYLNRTDEFRLLCECFTTKLIGQITYIINYLVRPRQDARLFLRFCRPPFYYINYETTQSILYIECSYTTIAKIIFL